LQNLINIIQFLKTKDELTTAHLLLRSFEKFSDNLEQYDLLGKLFHDVKAYPDSLRCVQKCLELASESQKYNVMCNIIKIYNETNEPDKALEYIRILEELTPDDISIQMEKNFSYFLKNEKDQSEAVLRNLLQRADINTEQQGKIRFNLGTYDLLHNRFKEGLRGFILEGKGIGIWPDDSIPGHIKVSDSNPLDINKSMLIKADGGIGDELINIRFMRYLPNATWLTTRQDLADIFNRCGYRTITYKEFKGYQDYNQATTSMQLPIWLDLSETDLWKGRYLEPSPESSKHLKDHGIKMKIGLRWSGNPWYEQNLHRSLNFEDLYKTVKNKYPDAILYSLQFPKEDIDYKDVIDLSPEISSFDDTLGIIDNLDLVITSCTSIAHAAGALDKPCVVLAPISAYYTWCTLRPDSQEHLEHSFWYSTKLSVLKQQVPKSWDLELSKI